MPNSLNEEKVYFKNLDGIRTIACLSVFISHFFDYIDNYKIDNVFERWLLDHFFNGLGAIGVNLFFVLSGFLISYFLFKEKLNSNSIDLKKFYLKRILRIWPVFFIVVVSGFFIIPLLTGVFQKVTITEHFWSYLLFINNFDRIQTHFTGIDNDSLGVLWSVAVEEQFYLIWPIIVYLLNPKKIPIIFILIILISLLFRYLNVNNIDILYYHTISLSADLAIGSLVAYLSLYSSKFTNFFYNLNKPVIASIYILLLALIFNSNYLFSFDTFKIIQRVLFSACFAFIIAEQNFSQNSFFKFKNALAISKFSIITYGFYCYHTFCTMMLQKANALCGVKQLGSFLFYIELILTFFLCYIISLSSYVFIEKKIVQFRKN